MNDTQLLLPVIRAIKPSDLDRVIEIDLKILERSRPDYWKMKFESAEKKSQVSFLVGEAEGHVAGFIIGGTSKWEYGVPEHIGWIDTIGVDPVYQRRGIAKHLFTEMTRRLKEMGVTTITTFVTRRDYVLLNYFKSLGFQKGDMINLELDI